MQTPAARVWKVPDLAWNVLDISSVPVEEFASALGDFVPVTGWLRQSPSVWPFDRPVRLETLADPPLRLACFPIHRGFRFSFVRRMFRSDRQLLQQLLVQSKYPECSPLVCTSAFFAPVAERWPGPVIYYSTDLTAAYDSVNPRQVRALDRRLCEVAQLVCPNSERIRDYLVQQADCDPRKTLVVPNATRRENVQRTLPLNPAELPPEIADLPRPLAGVIGNLAGNLDWLFLEPVIERTPWLSWAFVGPTSMHISDRRQRLARKRVMRGRERVRFTGARPYGLLKDYARSLDVAVLPYLGREPTFSGSPTRFFEHLAAGRPMLATPAVQQLIEKVPLVRLCNTPADMLGALAELHANGFHDGLERARWQQSRHETWGVRAQTMLDALSAVQADLYQFAQAPVNMP